MFWKYCSRHHSALPARVRRLMIRLRYRLQDRQIVPMTISISNVRANLSFSGADALCGITMKADISKVTKAIMSVKLQRKSGSTYVTVKNWRDESASADATGYIKFQRRFTVFDRGTYRVKVDGKVYKGSSVVDTFSVVSAERVY